MSSNGKSDVNWYAILICVPLAVEAVNLDFASDYDMSSIEYIQVLHSRTPEIDPKQSKFDELYFPQGSKSIPYYQSSVSTL